MDLYISLAWFVIVIITSVALCMASKKYGLELLVGGFVTVIILSNLIAIKPVDLWLITAGASAILYSISYIFVNTVNELWGKEHAKKTVLTGMVCMVLMAFISPMAISFPHASYWDMQIAFETVLWSAPRIVFAAITSYIIAQYANIWIYNIIRSWTNDRHLRLRNLVATLVTQSLDTAIFSLIAFRGVLPLWSIIPGGIIVKIVMWFVIVPFMYLITRYHKYQVDIMIEDVEESIS